MAKITTESRSVNGKKYEFPINCNSKGKFSTNYPVDMRAVQYKNEFDTADALLTEIARVCREFENLTKEVKFHICYTVKHRDKFGPTVSQNKISLSALELVFCVIREVTKGSSVAFHVLEENEPSHFKASEKEDMLEGFVERDWISQKEVVSFGHMVPYDPKMYELLKHMAQSIKSLAQRLNELVTPEKVLSLADGNVMALGA